MAVLRPARARVDDIAEMAFLVALAQARELTRPFLPKHRKHPIQECGLRKPPEFLPNELVFRHFMDRNHPKLQRERGRGKLKRWAVR